MATNKRHAVSLAQWEALLTSLATNSAELPELEKARTDLRTKMEEIQTLRAQHGLHQAAKQDALKRIATAIKEGQQIAAFLRTGVQHRFGKESEKLIEFGVPPFRSKRRKAGEIPATAPDAPALPASGVRGTTPA